MKKVKLRTDVVRELIARKNKSQNWFAKRIGISSSYMAQLLNGQKHPAPELRQKIQTFFEGKEFDDLFFFEN